MTPNEQELIDRLVTEVSSRKRLSGPLAKKFTDWMGSLDEYSLYSASHPSQYLMAIHTNFHGPQ